MKIMLVLYSDTLYEYMFKGVGCLLSILVALVIGGILAVILGMGGSYFGALLVNFIGCFGMIFGAVILGLMIYFFRKPLYLLGENYSELLILIGVVIAIGVFLIGFIKNEFEFDKAFVNAVGIFLIYIIIIIFFTFLGGMMYEDLDIEKDYYDYY